MRTVRARPLALVAPASKANGKGNCTQERGNEQQQQQQRALKGNRRQIQALGKPPPPPPLPPPPPSLPPPPPPISIPFPFQWQSRSQSQSRLHPILIGRKKIPTSCRGNLPLLLLWLSLPLPRTLDSRMSDRWQRVVGALARRLLIEPPSCEFARRVFAGPTKAKVISRSQG